MVCSKNAMAVLNIPRYKAPIIPVGVALMCTCFVKICSKADNIKATTNCVTVVFCCKFPCEKYMKSKTKGT